MENLDKYTPIELQKMGNDVKLKHDALKEEIINHIDEIRELEQKLNNKIVTLQELEDKYIMIIEKLVE